MSEALGSSSGGALPARRFRGEAARGKSSGRDIFRFLIVEDVVKGSCLCSSGVDELKEKRDRRSDGEMGVVKAGRECDCNAQKCVEGLLCGGEGLFV